MKKLGNFATEHETYNSHIFNKLFNLTFKADQSQLLFTNGCHDKCAQGLFQGKYCIFRINITFLSWGNSFYLAVIYKKEITGKENYIHL
jgi:hypothetical protein